MSKNKHRCVCVCKLNIKGKDQIRRVYDTNFLCPTIATFCGGNQETKIMEKENEKTRKLTPRECWRLMGFSDEDFDKAQASGVSDSQLYKQAGNSIVVQVLMAIFKNFLP